MAKQNNFFEIIKVGVILFLITAIAALILAFVNEKTLPTIEANTIAAQNEAMKKVFPEANNFEITSDNSFDSSVESVYLADDKGYVVLANPNGYGGAVNIAVGIDKDLIVTGVYVISQAETAGLGANCTKSEWLKQFVGKTEDIEVTKNGASGNQIDAISSATITSKAVTKGVNDAINAVKLLGGDK